MPPPNDPAALEVIQEEPVAVPDDKAREVAGADAEDFEKARRLRRFGGCGTKTNSSDKIVENEEDMPGSSSLLLALG